MLPEENHAIIAKGSARASVAGAEILQINPREPQIDSRLGWGVAMGGREGIEWLIAIK